MKRVVSLFLFSSLLLLGCSDKAKIQAKKNHINGYATECMMDVFFTYNTNWQKIEGESGIHGIDGLYIKRKKDHIVDVLVAESKYNTSHLGTTKKGRVKQMSKRWILDKLKEAKPYNPDIKNFEHISQLVKRDRYRARLFKLKPLKDGKFMILLYHIKSKDDDTKVIKFNKTKLIIDPKISKKFF